MSTAYALDALLNFGKIEERGTLSAIEKAVRYLLHHRKSGDNYMHWEGGVFFSGGTVVRNNLVWKSDAFTTAVILKALAKYRHFLDQKSLKAAPSQP